MVFLFIVLFILLTNILLIFSTIQIEIKNLKFNSQQLSRHINKNYEIIIKLLLLKFIPILKVNITKNKLEKLKLKEKIKNFDFKIIQNNKQFDKKALVIFKELNIDIQNIKLYVNIGTENASLTSILVPTISTIIAFILNKKIKKFENQIFKIQPIYTNQNLVNIDISGIFDIKISHIINIIYILNKEQKKGVRENNERTSNRRSYGYSYE